MTPADIARCRGVGDDAEGWREGCDDCLRRTSPPPNSERVVQMRLPMENGAHQEREVVGGA